MLSDAFARQGVFPSDLRHLGTGGRKERIAGRGAGPLSHVPGLTLAVRKKMLVSLLYPCVLIVLVVCLIVFLVTYVVPNFAALYNSMQAKLPARDRILIAVGTTARSYVLVGIAALAGRWRWRLISGRGARVSQETLDRWKMRTPLFGEIWTKYQVAQFSRVLSTLLVGGIPLVQALETSGRSLGTVLLKKALDRTAGAGAGREARFRASLKTTGIFPALVDRHDGGR